MNQLSRERQRLLLLCLCKGLEVGRTAYIVGCDPETVLRYLGIFGAACRSIHDRVVQKLPCTRLEVDEVWSYVGGKSRNKKSFKPGTPRFYGDIWTWTAFDPDHKLIVDWEVGRRGLRACFVFLQRIKARLTRRVIITTDAYPPYYRAIKQLFSDEEAVHVWVKKEFERRGDRETGDYKVKLIRLTRHHRRGMKVDLALASTSLAERHHATMRSFIKRLARRTYSVSKKPDNHAHAHAVYAVYYNFCKRHESLGHETPAMRAQVETRLWTADDMLDEIDDELARGADHPNESAADGRVPLLRGEASATGMFFVCNEVKRHTARVHTGHCSACNHGRGKKGGSADNLWYAFDDQGEAWKAAQELAPDHHSVCRICIGSYRTRSRSG